MAVPGETDLADLAAAAESDATPAEAFDSPPEVRGYFDVDGDVGTAQVFADDHWIVLSSSTFLEAADVQPLVEAILANLGDDS